MVVYVGGRTLAPAHPALVSVVYISTYVVLLGLALFGLVVIAISRKATRPWLLRGFSAAIVLFGVLMVLFPYSRLVAYPEGILAAIAIVLLVIARREFGDSRLWPR